MGEVYSSAMGKILEAKEKQTTKKNKPLEVLGDNDSYFNIFNII
jgi:hypothetical protein